MRLLLDTCVWGAATAQLRKFGHDVWWAGDLASDPGDEEILDIAVREDRILVTLDKDFGELVFLHGAMHKGIIRLVEIPSRLQALSVNDVLKSHPEALIRGAIVTIKDNHLRIRSPLGL